MTLRKIKRIWHHLMVSLSDFWEIFQFRLNNHAEAVFPVIRVVNFDCPDMYIGPISHALYLIKRGIDLNTLETLSDDHKVSSIGFSPSEKKWYGWSHRAICGFGIGSEVRKGDCAFKPSNRSEYIEDLQRWYGDAMYRNLDIEVTDTEIDINYEIHSVDGRIYPQKSIRPLDVEYGRGEWVAETMDDAKQMARDFAYMVC